MDRPIDAEFQKKRLVKRIAMGFVLGVLLIVMLAWAPRWIRPSLAKSRIRTAVVDVGPVEATITSSGTVVPELEQVLASPIDSRILKILKRPGSQLKRGDAIMELDVSQATLELNKLTQQLAIKQNQQAQRKLELENTLLKLQSQLGIKRLDLKSFQLQLTQQRKLWDAGLTSEGQLRHAEVLEETAQTELKQFEEEIVNARRATQSQLDGLALEIKTLEQERDEAQRQLDLATTHADRDGVLTWVVTEEGSAVRKGDVIARIADLTAFRVEAKVSDIHAGRLSVGLPVKIKVDEDYLQGSISNILPTIKDGIMTLLVGLEQKSSKLLRANLRVDVYIITDHKERALRIKRGPFANGEGDHEVFVIRGDMAVKVPVRLGIASFENFEVVNGLIQGDEVIISDMTEYLRMKEVKLD
jgi:HlyD family secretion protein